jgi:HlyD family secretion protein
MSRFRKWWILPLIIVIGGGIFFVVRAYQARQAQAALTNLQTETATRGTLTATVGAYGSARSNQSANVPWQTNGTVGKVDVGVGQTVKAGQELASLDPNSLPSNIVAAQQNLANAQTNLDNLLQSRIPTGQSQLAVAQDEKSVTDAQHHLNNVTAQTNASQDTINAAQANYYLAENKVKKLQKRYDHTPGKPEKSLVKATALSKLNDAIVQRDQALRTWNWDKAKPTDQSIAQANANLALANEQLASDQYKYNQLKSGPTANDIAAAKAAVASAQAMVNEAQLTAPFGGTITEVNIKPGDLASPGAVAFRIDDLSSMYVDLQVSEVDIKKVKVGQTVDLTFDAIPNRQHTGQVTQIGRVGVSSQGVVNFDVTAKIDHPDNAISPGMTVAANILVTEVPDALMVPNQAVQTINNQTVVFVLRNGQIKPVQVVLGASSGVMSQVVSGDLKAGDVIVLNPPASQTNQVPNRGPFFQGSGGS